MAEEADLESKCCEYALSRGVRNSKLGQNGDPDRIYWLDTDTLAWGAPSPWLVEFKKPGEEQTRLQKRKKVWFEGEGYLVSVVDNFEAFKALFEDLRERQ